MLQSIDVVRWPHSFMPNETTLRNLMDAECLETYRWSSGPNTRYHTHRHTFRKVLVVVRGSICFHLPDAAKDIVLHPGDRMTLEAGVDHSATVGESGVVCLEAHCAY